MKFFSLGCAVVALAMPKAPSVSPTVQTAQDFISTLTSEQKKQALFPIGDPERTNWSFVPGKRKGISWGEMTSNQKEAGMKLLKSALSADGFIKIETIRGLEMVLREMENGNMDRDPSKYWFVFFGTPNNESPWVWRYEGHHLSLTFGNRQGAVISSTPQFLGTNPAEVRNGPQKGTRVLAKEQDLSFRLVESLSTSQLAKANVAKDAPYDIITGSSRKAVIEGHLGIAYADLNKDQQKLLLELIQTHASVQAKAEQQRRMEAIKKDGYESLVFAWLGPINRSAGHYYRIQGKSFLIEYDNTQNNANHIHTTWRDYQGDFGEDALAEHYAHDHQH